MKSTGFFPSVPMIDRDTKFWMVRTKKGAFFDEFLREGFIAIGWNLLSKSMIPQRPTSEQTESLKAAIKREYRERTPGTSLHKCVRFCHEMRENDIAVIVDNNRIAFAYVGAYYEGPPGELTVEWEKEVHERIEKGPSDRQGFLCPYLKRRKISLIKVLDQEEAISPYLQNAITRNWHSLSDLSEYAELVLSCCFDTFIYRDKLTVTFRVRTNQAINVLDLANFTLLSANLLSDGHPEAVYVKTTLHSPGDVILQLWNTLQESALPLLICYMAVFGGKVGGCEFHSLLGFVQNLINAKFEREKQEITLRKLSAEANLVQQQALEKQLQNIEKARALQLAAAESCVEPLASAAKSLDIHPSPATVQDLQAVLEDQKQG